MARIHTTKRTRVGTIGLLVVVAAWVGGVSPASAREAATKNPVCMHSMLFSDTPYGFKDAMFREAAALGAGEIRVDLDLTAVFSPTGTDFSTADQYMTLSKRYHLKVLADITATPCWLATSPSQPDSYKCGTDQPAAYAHLIARIAAQTRGVIDDFELINEPDGEWAFTGSPQQYAWMLADVYRDVHAADPRGRILLGGVMGCPSSRTWLSQVFATPGANATHSFDVANVHLRDSLCRLGGDLERWRAFFARCGFHGPLWVTEHGYPSDPAYQTDPHYRGHDRRSGLIAQARYLAHSVPALLHAGAAKVFVTERDDLTGRFASEGVLSGQVSDPIPTQPSYAVSRKPAFATLAQLARRFSRCP
jgi:hypothetical protein